jgi:putative transposase
MDSELRFFDPRAHIRITHHNLPHWQQPGVTYFVTFRLADSLPSALLDRWRNEREAWMRRHPIPRTPGLDFEYDRLFTMRIEDWLDAGYGSCLLRTGGFREIVASAFAYSENVRYRLLAWVIMPTHVHACFALHPGWPLEKVIFTWKRRSARAINQARGATGSLWQHDYFDRIVRDAAHLGRVIRYVRSNPVKAGLGPGQFTLWESDDPRRF